MKTKINNKVLTHNNCGCHTSRHHRQLPPAIRPVLLYLLPLLYVTLCMTWLAAPAYSAGEPVTARFMSAGGKTISVQIKADRPVPGSVIFTLNLPHNVKLLEADPQAGKYDSGKRQVKWLLRGLSPGDHTIRLHFSADVKASQLRAEIRYLNSVTGKLCILPVRR